MKVAIDPTLSETLDGGFLVTEAGFGAKKFMNIKCRYRGLTPQYAVIVAKSQEYLQEAVQKADSLVPEGCVSLILRNPFDSDAVNRHKQTPLMLAAMNGKIACVCELLQASADILTCYSINGKTCLHYATYYIHSDYMRVIFVAADSCHVSVLWGFARFVNILIGLGAIDLCVDDFGDDMRTKWGLLMTSIRLVQTSWNSTVSAKFTKERRVILFLVKLLKGREFESAEIARLILLKLCEDNDGNILIVTAAHGCKPLLDCFYKRKEQSRLVMAKGLADELELVEEDKQLFRELFCRLELSTNACLIKDVFEQKTNEVVLDQPWVRGVRVTMFAIMRVNFQFYLNCKQYLCSTKMLNFT